MGTIKCSSVSKSFRKIEAVRGVTLLVNSGEVAALIGPNGAGKSTLMKMMVGLVKPDSGTVEVGENADGDCGFMIEEPSFYPHLSGLDNLSIIASLSRQAGSRMSIGPFPKLGYRKGRRTDTRLIPLGCGKGYISPSRSCRGRHAWCSTSRSTASTPSP